MEAKEIIYHKDVVVNASYECAIEAGDWEEIKNDLKERGRQEDYEAVKNVSFSQLVNIVDEKAPDITWKSRFGVLSLRTELESLLEDWAYEDGPYDTSETDDVCVEMYSD